MKDKNAFFSSKNTIDRITDADVENTPDYLEAIKTFTEITNKSVYVVDYQKQGFEYVSDNPLFLCGYTAEEVKEMGYDYYFKQIPQKDLELLLKINVVGFDFYETIAADERKDHYISYDFHIQMQDGKTILVHQKLTPLFFTESGKVWKAICIVSLSTAQNSGNITIHKKNSNETFVYDLEGEYWKTILRQELSDREKEILQYSIRGYSISEMADKLFISPDTVKFHRKKMFEKLEVSNITEAISQAAAANLIQF